MVAGVGVLAACPLLCSQPTIFRVAGEMLLLPGGVMAYLRG